jgi:hypothetical protein
MHDSGAVRKRQAKGSTHTPARFASPRNPKKKEKKKEKKLAHVESAI